MVVLMDPCDDSDDVLRANRSREKQYVFDLSFGPAATQVGINLFNNLFKAKGDRWG